jgi:diguanylate cyclase (GGDEF)-like protein/PAS domain S-box-containing protein
MSEVSTLRKNMPSNILLIQGDAAEAAAVRDALGCANSGQFHIEWVRTCAVALDRLQLQGKQHLGVPDGIAAMVVDLSLPDSNGIETFDRLFGAAPQIPILVMVSAKAEPTAKLAVQRGAQDYLLKGRLYRYFMPKAVQNMLERNNFADAMFIEKERAEVTLNSIGDAVMSTDEACSVTYLNSVAEQLTGWTRAEAIGRPVNDVFAIIDEASREPTPNPLAKAMRENRTVGLTPNCVLVRRDGYQSAIEDSAAPIHDRQGVIRGAVIVFRDVSAARMLSSRMSHLAQHDALTDLPNRSLLNDRLAQAMVHRHETKFALLYLDIDRFKLVNDTAGHTTGDRLVQLVAARLVDSVRKSDTVSRHGGDEFVILLSEVAHAEAAGRAAEKILVALDAPYHIDQWEFQISASIGIAIYPGDGTSAEALLKNADAAMYRAKNCGRNNYQFFEPEMNRYALEHHGIEIDLRHALDRSEFLLHYQPKLNLWSGRVTGVEALIRWRRAGDRLVMPEQFMSIAEDSGLIVPIGKWVLREACRQAKAWELDGLPPLSLSVNVSAVELQSKSFVAGVRAILAETGLAARFLELEITETFLMQDAASTGLVLRELKEIGIRLALDDFGTGFSSLSYLKRFPIDTLKIDRSFIRDLTSDPDDASIVTAVIRMSEGLHMQVVAEGVETQEQCALLKRWKCPEAQGFYFSGAVPPEELAVRLKQEFSPTGILTNGHKTSDYPAAVAFSEARLARSPHN